MAVSPTSPRAAKPVQADKMEGIAHVRDAITVVGNIDHQSRPQAGRRPGAHQVPGREQLRVDARRRGSGSRATAFFVTVNCWGKLVTGVGAALGKGDPVIVVGHVYTSEYEDREGVRRSSVEIRATSVGPDLARCIARIESQPSHRNQWTMDPRPLPSADEGAATTRRLMTTTSTDDDSALSGRALPLTA